jgi:hypothetical protein
VRSTPKAAAGAPAFELAATAEDHPLLTMTGEEGVVTLEAWWHEGIPLGVLTIHSPVPLRDGQPPSPGPNGTVCYEDVDYKSGFKAAELFLSQHEDLATSIMVTCYRWYLLGERSR